MTALNSSEQLQPLPIDQIPVDHVFMRAQLDWMLDPAIPLVVRRLYAVYGPVVVTPVDVTDPPEDFQATLTPEYQAKLSEADKLAVHVGGNQHLRCVVFAKTGNQGRGATGPSWCTDHAGHSSAGHEWLVRPLPKGDRTTNRAPIDMDMNESTT